MKTTKNSFINFNRTLAIAGLILAGGLILASCQTTGSNVRDDARGRPGSPSLYHGMAFDVTLPPGVQNNRKKTDKEIVHYFFTQEMAKRKVGMGIYEGVAARSMVRYRNDLIVEESNPVRLDRFVGSVQSGSTYRGKRWREYFLFPSEGNFVVQLWYFDVLPEDEAVFSEIIKSLRATYKISD